MSRLACARSGWATVTGSRTGPDPCWCIRCVYTPSRVCEMCAPVNLPWPVMVLKKELECKNPMGGLLSRLPLAPGSLLNLVNRSYL